MARKQDVLDILEQERIKKATVVRAAYEDTIAKQDEIIRVAKDALNERVSKDVCKAVARLGITPNKGYAVTFRNNGCTSWDSRARGTDVGEIDLSQVPVARKALAAKQRIVTKRDAELAAINERSGAMRRQIQLHGVDPELLKMLQGFIDE